MDSFFFMDMYFCNSAFVIAYLLPEFCQWCYLLTVLLADSCIISPIMLFVVKVFVAWADSKTVAFLLLLSTKHWLTCHRVWGRVLLVPCLCLTIQGRPPREELVALQRNCSSFICLVFISFVFQKYLSHH